LNIIITCVYSIISDFFMIFSLLVSTQKKGRKNFNKKYFQPFFLTKKNNTLSQNYQKRLTHINIWCKGSRWQNWDDILRICEVSRDHLVYHKYESNLFKLNFSFNQSTDDDSNSSEKRENSNSSPPPPFRMTHSTNQRQSFPPSALQSMVSLSCRWF
jgi:hypothetical protein